MLTPFNNEKEDSPNHAAMKEASRYVDRLWRQRDARWGMCLGKEIFSQLSAWSQQHFNVSLNAYGILRTISKDELNPELKAVVEQIEAGEEICIFRDGNKSKDQKV